MPDFGSPVAQNVNVNPNQGITLLSNIMSLKRQQQQLQTGVYQQEAAQAGAQQEQQTAQQRAGLATFMKSFDPTQHVGADGTLDLDSVLTDPKLRQSAGDQFPQVVDQMIGIKQHQLTAKQQLVALNDSVRIPFLGMLGGLRTDADVISDNAAGRQKVKTAVDQFAETSPDAARIAQIYGPMTEHAPPGKLVQAISIAQLQGMDAATQASKQAPALASTGGALVNTNPQAAGGNLGGTPSIPTSLPPQVITQPGTGAPAVVGGAQGTTPKPIGPAGASLPTNWWNPAPGQTQLLTANTAGLAGRIQQGQASANSSPQALDALQRARAILDRGTWTGGTFSLFKDLRNTAAGLGMDTSGATDANELVKNLARYEASRAAGVGNTDAARSLFETGAPNTKVDAQAAKNIVTQSIGNELAIQGYAKVVGSAPDPQTAAQREQAFRSVPNMVQAYEYGLMRSPKEADDFLAQYNLTKQQIAKARSQLRQLGAL